MSTSSTVTEPAHGLSYKSAGVDIALADQFVDTIGTVVKATHAAALLGQRGGDVVPHTGAYAGLFRPAAALLQSGDPLLAAACDGVGTKLLVARDMGLFEGLGQDLVAMNVNDLLPSGARPLLFLDYIATGKLDPAQLTAVVRGIAKACQSVGCVLLGGETAEMPGLYPAGDFDLAGFTVGMADGARLPQQHTVQPGDRILALPSSGIHANGFSLARKALLERGGLDLHATPASLTRPLGVELLEPTRLYVHEVHAMLQHHRFKAAAHITGGGLLGRLQKMTRPGLGLVVDASRYTRPAIFDLIARTGDVPMQEMAHTFNMGLGFVIIVDPATADAMGTQHPEWRDVGCVVEHAHGGVELGYARS